MKLAGKHIVVTGAARGIGAALARRLCAENARGLVVADKDSDALEILSEELGALPVPCDVSQESDVQALVAEAEAAFGPIDVFCSNAGIFRPGNEAATDSDWQDNWDLHVMAHVYAARALAGKMATRGEGYFVITASAAGLLTHIDSASYAVSKHASVAFAEWLAIAYGDSGVKVSVLCPQAVRTDMVRGHEAGVASLDGLIEADQVASSVVAAIEREEFLILPHPAVRQYMERKASDPERWLAGMRKLKARFHTS